MSQEFQEFSAKTLDDAITEACQKLAVPSDRLEYEVVDQGSAGFLGFNARNAVIKARVKEEITGRSDKVQGDVLEEVHTAADSKEDAEKEEKPVRTQDKRSEEKYYSHSRSDYRHKSDRRSERSYGSYRPAPEYHEETPHVSKYADEPKVDYTEEQAAEFEKKAVDFLDSVFKAMNMDVKINARFDHTENVLSVDFEGEDMGVLIGKRGQTLDSIQYLVSLVVNKGISGYVHVKADTENYRERRKKTLENLARNMAFKVRKTRRSVALEPMNPYERRIIHSALQGDRYVTTYSEGEDPYRKVIITLKK